MRLTKRWALAFVLIALPLPLLSEALRVTLGSNFHTVLDGRLYRCGQPSGAALENYIHRHGIHTVINLRGPNNQGEDWFDAEVEAARRCGVDFISINLSASDKPQEQEVRRLVAAFDRSPEPILLHCNSGSDRSGFASACFLLMKTSATPDEARGQLSLRYGHFSWGRAGCLGEVLDQYKHWLAAERRVHQPENFRKWALEVYIKDDWPLDMAF